MLKISWTSDTITQADNGDLELQSAEHSLVFDAVTNETHDGSALVTEHAVERGVSLSDHKRPDPRRISITALVTQTPIEAPPPSGYERGASVGADVGPAPGKSKANVLVFDGSFDRLGDVFLVLQKLVEEGVLVTISTRLTTYDDMTIVSFSIPRSPELGESIEITIDAQSVRVAETRTVDAPAPREPRGRRRSNRGSQEASEETGESSSAGQSILSGATEAIENGGLDGLLEYGQGLFQ